MVDFFIVDGSMYIFFVFWIFLFGIYFAFLESSIYKGTIGKQIVGIKVVDYNGQKVTFEKALYRFSGKCISILFFLIGFVMILYTDRNQGLHDLMAKTLVLNK